MGNKINFEETKLLINELSGNEKGLRSTIVKSVCYFNLFESYLYENNIKHWYEFFNKFTIDESMINEYFEFFYNRYVDNNNVNEKFNGFYGLVKDNYLSQLKNDLIQKQNKSKSVLSISYYFRNNLYHGHKAICELDRYEQCFGKITDFLLKVMESSKEKK